MAAFLGNLRNTIIAGLVLAICMIVAFGKLSPQGFDRVFWEAVLRWIHVFFGILVGTYSSIYVALPVILLWGVRRDDEEAAPIRFQQGRR